MMVTILDCAIARGATAGSDGSITMKEVSAVGFTFFAGCGVCGSSLACYNAYPTKAGYIRCLDCIGLTGFETAAQFEAWCELADTSQPDDDYEEYSHDYEGCDE